MECDLDGIAGGDGEESPICDDCSATMFDEGLGDEVEILLQDLEKPVDQRRGRTLQ